MNRLFTVLVVLCLATTLSLAQSDTARISGQITDKTGAVLPGVQVTVTNVDTNISSTTTTNESGIYVVPNLRAATYRMTIVKDGFSKIVKSGIVLNVQDALDQNFQLAVGSVSESVMVAADAIHVNTQDASVSTVVDAKFVENIPLNGRSFQSLIYMVPGVTILSTCCGTAQGTFSVNGQRDDANYFTVDGVSANTGIYPGSMQALFGTVPGLTAGGGTNGLVSVDAMQEFRIQTSSFAPEFGRTPGGQISIATKSGTNEWHGTAFDYLRNDVLDARNYFDAPPLRKAPLRQNDFGGTLGGPIWKKHTFFFFSYEGLRAIQPIVEAGWFVTPATRANVSGPWSPILNSLPVPDASAPLADPSCDNITNPCLAEIKAATHNFSNFDAISLRVDHRLTNKISLFARYNHTPSNFGSPNFQETDATNVNTDTLTGGMTWTLAPTMLNDLRANWSRTTGSEVFSLNTFHGATIPSSSTLYPPGYEFGTSQAFFDIGAGGVDEQVREGTLHPVAQRQLNFVDTLSKTVGTHQLKFGVDFRRLQPSNQNVLGASFFAFAWPSIQSGSVDFTLVSTSISIKAHMNNWSLFGQDTWRVTPRLTITYGLRWDMNTPPVSDSSGKPLYTVLGVFDSNLFSLGPAGTPLWHTQHDAFAPRIGAAFQVTPHAVIRGGFGMFYDLGYGGGPGLSIGSTFPYNQTTFIPGLPLDLNNPALQPAPFTTTISPSVTQLGAVDPHLRLPVTYEWNAALERQLGAKQTVTATWVGAYGQDLLRSDLITPPGSPLAVSGGQVNATRNAGRSRYDSLQLQFMRRVSHGLQAMIGYTLAKSQDLGSSDSYGGTYAATVNQVVLPPLSPSDFDFRNTLSVAVSYDLPAPAWGRPGQALLGGWGVDGILHVSSAGPMNIQVSAVDPSGLYYRTNPDLVPGQPIWIPDPSQPAGKALNPAAFTLPAPGALPSFLRNSIRSPYTLDQTDLALRRTFKITERLKLVARVEYFNIFNHPMFGAPNSFWGYCSSNTPASCSSSFAFGKLVDFSGQGNTLNGALGGAGGGGQDPLYAPGGPRSGQISLKFIF